MRVVFMGTPGFAASILENLIAQHEVVGVYTRPDAVRARGKKLVPSPVKQIAMKAHIPVFTPKTLRDVIAYQQLKDLEPDIICVAAYGAILPPEILDIPALGALNVHASLLPKWRGAAPVERAILAGDETTGVCIMRMEEGLDTGDYCVVRATDVGSKSTTELTIELASLGASALLTAMSLIEEGTVEWKKQDDFFATYAEKIGKHEFFLDPKMKAADAVLKVQASSHAHPARCRIASRDVTVVCAERERSRLRQSELGLKPGYIKVANKSLYVGFSDAAIKVTEIRPDGKRTMSGIDFAAGIQNVKSGLITWEGLNG